MWVSVTQGDFKKTIIESGQIYTANVHSTLPTAYATVPTLPLRSTLSLRPRLHPLIIPTPNILQSPLKVPPRILQPTRVLGSIKIRMYQLDQPIQVLRSHSLVLLVEVVDVAVQDLDEELDGDGGVHAGVCDSEGALEALEDALAVAVGLGGWC